MTNMPNLLGYNAEMRIEIMRNVMLAEMMMCQEYVPNNERTMSKCEKCEI